SRSLGRRTRQLLFFAFLSISTGVFLLSVGVLLYLIPFSAEATTGFVVQRIVSVGLLIVGGLLVLLGLFYVLRSVVRRRENDLATLTGEYLSQYLDERYKFIRNINRPVLGYIDAVLVGPPGILVFRILDAEGDFINDKNSWARKNRGGAYMPWGTNPTHEAVVDVRAVREFLKQNQILNQQIFGVVVFIEDEPSVAFQTNEPVVPVTHLTDLLDTLKQGYLTQERTEQRLVDRITKLLLGEL
ncbi:MAG: NERD domain-containing protein, partial [Chloroflexota bacterium]